MNTYSVNEYATVCTNTVEVHRFDDPDSGYTYLTALDTDRPAYGNDACGYVTVRRPHTRWDTDVLARGCCKWCTRVQKVADRLNEAYDVAVAYGVGYQDEGVEAMLKVLTRMDMEAFVISGDDGVVVAPANDVEQVLDALDHDGHMVVGWPGATWGYARECAALINQRTWVVGSMPTADIDPDDAEDLTPGDCRDCTHGVVWDNVDDDGDSSPTLEELLNRF